MNLDALYNATPEQVAAEAALKRLNTDVAAALKARSDFLDANMHLFAEFQIGDEVVNVSTGEKYTVSKHYRYDADHDRLYDASFDVDCELRRGNCYDNTSRLAGMHPFVPAKDAAARNEKYIRALERSRRAV